MKDNIKIAIADDHQIITEGLKSLLESEKDLSVIATANTGREAIDICSKFQVDIIILDISMPELNGLEAARIIKRKAPETKIIILSMHNDRFYLQEALLAGADAFILKDSAFCEIVQAIHAVRNKQKFFSDSIIRLLIDEPALLTPDRQRPLTKREKEILQLIVSGKTGKEIARIMQISYKTVDCHRQSLKRKLGAKTLTELTKVALQKKL